LTLTAEQKVKVEEIHKQLAAEFRAKLDSILTVEQKAQLKGAPAAGKPTTDAPRQHHHGDHGDHGPRPHADQ
jgi:hypothetical protein